ncbi:DUF4177 domain-containing protein [Xinfangfangia sp. D13-10-4-6]|uniref:DUF4177 domain-containing protein n=1 Tax=Pseudogemmobacter hezensis TaxID=2737662 RepID=UPI0015579B28|nr:DUF4177 domain-containing protein [Pseudogemmobacter hezensis]NPD13615.1 DUF4177 domain-containing protein [Pseudogemmobacter hezensis]
MQRFEYKVVPAPRRGEKARGVKTSEDRFALALSNLMNELAAEGWDYVRADSLPCDERSGLTGTKTTHQNMLVFRRELALRSAAPLVSPAVAVHTTGAKEAAVAVAAAETGQNEASQNPLAKPGVAAVGPAIGAATGAPALGAASAPASRAPSVGPARSGGAAE